MYKAASLIAFLLCIHLLHGQSAADTSVSGKINDYLISANLAYKFNGTALIAEKGKTLLCRGYGLKNTSTHALNDTNSIFRIGSLTKSFTSVIILKLQEEGKLSVQDKISQFFPDYPKGDNITIEHLLTHTSGIYNYTDDISEADTNIICYPVSKARVLQLFERKKLAFRPGTKFEYDNSDYFLLGMIIEKVTGLPYEKVVRDKIFTPLQMTHSGFDFRNLADTHKVTGYVVFTKEKTITEPVVDSTVYYAGGAMYSTVGDLYKWAAAIGTHRLLSDASQQQAFTNFHQNNYGYGFFVDSLYGRNYIRHSGGALGLMSDYVYFPKEDVIILLLNNFGNYGQSLFPVAAGIASIVFHLPYSNWQTDTSNIRLSTDLLAAYAGTYQYDKAHRLIVAFSDSCLYVEATNPKDLLPKVRLYALTQHVFFMKEAQLKFSFLTDERNIPQALYTYIVEAKKEEWKKIK
jgi:CubicO group peptidase (beta-lactamase class C family)